MPDTVFGAEDVMENKRDNPPHIPGDFFVAYIFGKFGRI